MRPGGSSEKGGEFERLVCRDLSRFIDRDDTDTYFWRSSMSGGRATIQARQGIINQTQIGDITCIHPKGHWFTAMFAIECKHRKSMDILAGLLLGRGELKNYWREISKIAAKHDRSPLLIAKQNRLPTIVVLDEQGLQKLRAMGYKVPVVLQSEMLKKHRTSYVCFYDEVFK